MKMPNIILKKKSLLNHPAGQFKFFSNAIYKRKSFPFIVNLRITSYSQQKIYITTISTLKKSKQPILPIKTETLWSTSLLNSKGSHSLHYRSFVPTQNIIFYRIRTARNYFTGNIFSYETVLGRRKAQGKHAGRQTWPSDNFRGNQVQKLK